MSVTYNFKGKRVLVTGGGREKGLGRAVVEKFLAAGATVFVLGRDPVQLGNLKKALPTVNTVCVDLLDWDESKKKVEALAPIHHLVNNAGIAEATYFKDMTPENIDKTFGVNFKAMINMGQVMAKGLSEKNSHNGGTIVNVSSILDSRTVAGAGLYCCTKAAVGMLTKVMAAELASQNIRVNSIRPTLMVTEMIAKTTEADQKMADDILKLVLNGQLSKRLLTVEQAANVVLYLSSDASEMVNGTDILIDGGLCTK